MAVDGPRAARRLTARGFCPVECAFGATSVTDDLELDHHGRLSDRDPVALRALAHQGVRRSDPRFVTAGRPDADSAFAIGVLAGLVDDAVVPLSAVAETVAAFDTAPYALDPRVLLHGGLVLAWRTVAADLEPALGNAAGVIAWRQLLRDRDYADEQVTAAMNAHHERVQATPRVLARARRIGHVCWIPGADPIDWPTAYGRIPGQPVDSAAGWERPLLALSSTHGTVTVCTPGAVVAEELFGDDGLLRVAARLGEGWGGRPSIIGSPRGAILDVDQQRAAVRQVALMVR